MSDLNFDVAPSIAQTSDGKIWVTWQKEASSTQSIFYKTSSDYGITWSLERNLTAVPSFDTNIDPTIFQLSNGTIMVVWAAVKPPPPEPSFDLSATPPSLTIPKGNSNTTTITVTSIGGFSSPVTLSKFRIVPPAPDISCSFAPNPVTPQPYSTVNSTMTIQVGALTQTNNYTITVMGKSENPARNDTVPVKIVVPNTGVLGSANSVSAADAEDMPPYTYDIFCRASHDNGTTWSNEIKLVEDPADDLGPSILQSSNGTIWLVWSSTRTGNAEIFYKTSSNLGASWSSDTQLTFDSNKDLRPAIVQMQDERIWVAWHTDRYGADTQIAYKIYNGASWTSDTRLTFDAILDNLAPALLQEADGTIWVFWAAIDNATDYAGDIYYKKSLNNGESWTNTELFTTDPNEDTMPAVTQTVDSKIWVLWMSNRSDHNWDIYYRASLVHNIAVTKVKPSQMKVYQGEEISAKADILNSGDYAESFNLFYYANTTQVDSRTLNLNPKSSTQPTLSWNTLGFSRGNYFITVNASVVAGELYTKDNTATHGPVRVKLLGDVDDNGVVSGFDLYALGKAFASTPGALNWNEEADMNGDSVVNTIDLSSLTQNYGKKA